jgi:hypothetical protein
VPSREVTSAEHIADRFARVTADPVPELRQLARARRTSADAAAVTWPLHTVRRPPARGVRVRLVLAVGVPYRLHPENNGNTEERER